LVLPAFGPASFSGAFLTRRPARCAWPPSETCTSFFRIYWLARSTLDLLTLVNWLVERGIGFRSPGDSWLDTTSPQARFLLVVFAGLAEWERELIRIRTTEGRARVMAAGKRSVASRR
jgi:DNA invertase Pin-like site-specific DNA recombinase